MPDIFGFPTPQEVQDQRFSQAVQLFSQAAPGVAPAVVAGQGLGRATGAAFGLGDAQTERAKRMQDVYREASESGMNPGDAGYIDFVTQALNRRGLFDAAAMVKQQGSKLEKAALESEKLRVGNEKAKLELSQLRDLAMDEKQLSGTQRSLNRIAKADWATADLKNAASLAAAGFESQGIEATPRMLAVASQQIYAASKSLGRTTTSRESFDGTSVSSTTADVPAQFVNQAVQRAIAMGGAQPQQGQPVQPQPQFSGQPLPRPANARIVTDGETLPTQDMLAEQRQSVEPVRSVRGETVSTLDLDTAARLGDSGGGSIPLSSMSSPDQIMQREGLSKKRLEDRQEVAESQVSAASKLMRGQNEIARIIESEGQAFPTTIARWASLLEKSALGSQSWTGDILRASGNVLREIGGEFTDSKDALIVAKLNRAVQSMVLIEKERTNLGALTGPDVGILSQVIANPVSFLFRRTGINGYFEAGSAMTKELLVGAQEAVGKSGLRGQSIPAPHPWFRLAQHKADVADIIGQLQDGSLSTQQAAGQMRKRLGFPVTPTGAEMLSGTGRYKRAGGTIESLANEARSSAVGAAGAIGRNLPSQSESSFLRRLMDAAETEGMLSSPRQ